MKKKILLLSVLVMLALSSCKGMIKYNDCFYFLRQSRYPARTTQYKVVCVNGGVPLVDTPQRTWLPLP